MIEIGDRVMSNDDGERGTVVQSGVGWHLVRFDNGTEVWEEVWNLEKCEE